jgi:DNA polymerase-3 subunit beta
MKVLVEQKEFLDKASNLTNFIDKKDDLLTSNFYIQATQNTLIVKATNLKIGLSIKIDSVIVEEEGIILVNGVELLKVIKVLKNKDKIQFQVSGSDLKISQGRTKFYVKISAKTDFYSFPTVENKSKIMFNSEVLQKGLKYISTAINENSPKQELTGGLISIANGTVSFVGTDTKRLALKRVKMDINHLEDLNIILPLQAISLIPKLFTKEEIDLIYNSEFAIVEDRDLFFFTKLINGKYPQWERIIPTEIKLKLELPRKELIQGLKTVLVVDPLLKIVISSEGLDISTLEDGLQTAETFVEHSNQNLKEKIVFGINGRYILDFLNQINDENFIFEFTEPNRPIVISNDLVKTIIMPINM